MDNFKSNFDFEPSNQHVAMLPDYKPTIYTTGLCNAAEKSQYWKCIGEMQWAIALLRIDIIYATVVLSWYHPGPQKGYLAKIQHLYGYLKKYTSTSIKFNTVIP